MEDEQAALVRSWLQEFVEASMRAEEVITFVRRVDDSILAEMPELSGDPGLAEELHASTREHWRNFLVGLGGDHRLALPPAAVALSLSFARRNFDIGVLLKVYRIANRTVFRYLAERTDPATLPRGLARDEALLALWTRADLWINESVEQLIDHFTREKASLAAGVHARRAEMIELLLAGTVPTREAEMVLGHRLTHWQTAFVLSAPPSLDEAAPLFETAVKACRLLGLPQPMTQLAGSRELWGWAATPREPTLDHAAVQELLSSAGLHLGLGRPGRGPSAFRLSHQQAVAAHHLGLVAPGVCHTYAGVEVTCLIGDGELAREMVRRTLGPLLDGAKDETLRQTALVFLRAGQRFDLAAAELSVHANTVRYRIGRVEELLGTSIADRAALLELCLGWIEVYGADRLG